MDSVPGGRLPDADEAEEEGSRADHGTHAVKHCLGLLGNSRQQRQGEGLEMS